ncbi:MAG: DUF4286 family protein [Tannerella sp.]|jgi:hypothetical protein|nr:DUF4286 family protein [Tannerella sp.]
MIYHTTFHLDNDIWDDGLLYLKQQYIPRAIQGGLLDRPVMQRVLQDLQEDEAGGGVSLCIQFRVEDRETLHRWMQREGAGLQRELSATFGAKIAGFSTLLEEMELA